MSKEHAIQFGGEIPLSAVVSEPTIADPNRPAFILLNAGLLHRVGPYRMNVVLARALARLGFYAVRLDLSGIGYSPRRVSAKNANEAAIQDIQECFAMLEKRYRASSFVLVGLCSGASNAHRAALRDTRVIGSVFMDGYAYRTARYYFNHYLPRLFSLRKWRDWLAKRLAGFLHQQSETDKLRQAAADLWTGGAPPHEKIAKELQQLVDRQCALLFIFAGGSGYYSYRDQFFDSFPEVDFKNQLSLEYFAEADHMYILPVDQNELIERICVWTQDYFLTDNSIRKPAA
jgi:dienelactone hydrolase